MWLGATGFVTDMVFAVPEGFRVAESDRTKAAKLGYVGNYTRLGNSCWFTNIDHGRRHQPLSLMTMADNLKFNKKMADKGHYQKYVNYDAIEVPFTTAIPSDYTGHMGVPISFLNKYSAEQFEIIGESLNLAGRMDFAKRGSYQQGGPSFYIDNGDETYTRLYKRIVIRHRKASS